MHRWTPCNAMAKQFFKHGCAHVELVVPHDQLVAFTWLEPFCVEAASRRQEDGWDRFVAVGGWAVNLRAANVVGIPQVQQGVVAWQRVLEAWMDFAKLRKHRKWSGYQAIDRAECQRRSLATRERLR